MAFVQMFVALMTHDPIPSADIVRPLGHLTGCEGGGERCNLLGIIPLYVQGQGLDGKSRRSWKKGMNNKEGKKNHGKDEGKA